MNNIGGLVANPEYVAYGSFTRKKTGAGFSQRISKAGSVERVRALIDQASERAEASKAGPDQSPSKELTSIGEGVWHFYDQLNSYHELAFFIDQVPSAVIGGFFESQFVNHAKNEFKNIETYKDHDIYALRHVGCCVY